MSTVIVVHQDVPLRLRGACQEVPAVDGQRVAGDADRRVRHTSRRHDDDVDVGDLVGVDIVVAPQLDPESAAFRDPPVDDADQIAPALRGRGQRDLAAERVARLIQRHGMTPLGEHPCGFQPGRTAADDSASFRFSRGCNPLRQPQLAPGRRVVDAMRRARRVDRVQADTRTDARPNAIGVPGGDLAREIRIGYQRPGHPHQVQQSLRDRVAGGRDVGDLRGVHDGHVDLLLHPPRELQVRAGRSEHRRDHLRQLHVGVGPAADDAEEIDPRFRVRRRHPDGFLGPGTTAIGALLVERHPHPDDEVVTDRSTHRGDHLERKSDPVLQRTAVLVLAMVERRRHELIEQMPAVGRYLDAVETSLLTTQRGLGEVARDPRQIAHIRDPGEGPMGGLAGTTGRQGGNPVVRVVVRPMTHMRELRHHRSPLLMDVVTERPQIGHGLVPVQL